MVRDRAEASALSGARKPMSIDDFDVLPTRESDVDEINALYERVSGRVRSTEQWRREWRSSPFGPGRSWVIRERSSARLVGHHGLIEVPLRAPDRVLRAARTENTMVDPEYRTALYYPAVEAQLLATYRDDFDVLFTAAGNGPQAAMRRRLGYRPVGKWIDFTIYDSLAHRAARELGRAGAVVTGWIDALRMSSPSPEFELHPTDDVERVERLWKSCCAPTGVSPERSASYLRWRLLEHAWHRFELAVVTRGGTDVAFLAWRQERGRRGALKWRVEDVFALDDDEELLRAAFEQLAWRARGREVRVTLRATGAEQPLARAAASAQSAWSLKPPTESESELLFRAPTLPREWEWRVSRLVDQGI